MFSVSTRIGYESWEKLRSASDQKHTCEIWILCDGNYLCNIVSSWLIITKQYHWIFHKAINIIEAAPIGRKNKLNKRHKAMHDTTRIQKQHKLNKDGRTGGTYYRARLFTVIIHVNHLALICGCCGISLCPCSSDLEQVRTTGCIGKN